MEGIESRERVVREMKLKRLRVVCNGDEGE